MPAFYDIQKRTSSFGEEKKTRYYLIAKSWSRVSYPDLISSMVRHTTLSRQEAMTSLAYLLEAIPRLLRLGNTIDLGELGRFQLAIRSEGSDTPQEATWRKIRDIRVCFVPSTRLRNEIRELPVERFPDKGLVREGSAYKHPAMKRAKQEGAMESRLEVARQCLLEGLSVEQTARISGLSEQQLASERLS